MHFADADSWGAQKRVCGTPEAASGGCLGLKKSMLSCAPLCSASFSTSLSWAVSKRVTEGTVICSIISIALGLPLLAQQLPCLVSCLAPWRAYWFPLSQACSWAAAAALPA